MPNSPVLYGPNNTAQNLQNQELLATGQLIQYNGDKNYLAGNFETSTVNGWSAFTTTLTSGLPTGSITLTSTSLALGVTSTTPLEGVYSLQVVASTAALSGQGIISPVFTIDRDDSAKVLTSKIYYEAISGTATANWSGILGSQSFAVYIRDVSNGVWVQPAGFLGMNQGIGPGYTTQTYQTNALSAGNQYQLAIICLQSTSGPITLNFDNLQLGPQTAPIGLPASDPAAYTPNTSNLGTVTAVTANWSRIGKFLFGTVNLTTGITAASPVSISIPTQFNIDTTSQDAKGTVGTWSQTGVADSGGIFTQLGTSTQNLYLSLGSSNYQTPATGTNIPNTAVLALNFRVPIAGWSSNVQMSNDTDTRVCGLIASGTPASVTANNPIIYPTVVKDTHGAYNTTTGQYAAPITGFYQVYATIQGGSIASDNTLSVYVASSLYSVIGFDFSASVVTGSNFGFGSGVVYANAGQTIDVRPQGAYSSGNTSYLQIIRVTGPSVIAATESVNMRYFSSSTTVSGTLATVVYSTKGWDTHLAYNPATGIYTAPISGKYQVNASIAMTGAFILNSTLDLQVQQTGSATQTSESKSFSGGAVTQMNTNVGDIFYMLAGDSLKVQVSNSGTTPAIAATTTQNWLSIARVGN